MNPGLIVRLRPAGPWRIGPASGARNGIDPIFHSDSLYSALTHAMAQLGSLEEWIAATAAPEEGEPAVRFSSCFPYQRDVLFAPPPRTLWPPAHAPGKVRWQGARFVPLAFVAQLCAEQSIDEERWTVDGATGCVLPSDRAQQGPFRNALRRAAAVDRIHGATAIPHTTACLEFTPDAGLWCAVSFASDTAKERWDEPVRAAFRLLADSGLGGERSRGWGRADAPEFAEGSLPGLVFAPAEGQPPVEQWWLLSLFAPGNRETIDWNRGNYAIIVRGGRIESAAGWGALKLASRMVAEGSVLLSAQAPTGSAANVAPDGFPHPVYRYGFPVAIPLPARGGGA
jgi:CRISPR type III-A-associated RAMP protein Csm4